MQKIYYLVFVMLYSIPGHAANCVTTTQVKANYKTQQVTFKLTWIGCNGTTHLNKAWCIVDFQPVDAAGNKGAWQRATISGTPLVTNGTYAAGNATGFEVTGTNGQSATVTVKLGNASGKFNWCAIATDYPPQAIYGSSSYTLKGTPPFTLVTISGTTVTTISKTFTDCLTAITDATGRPGSAQPCRSNTCQTCAQYCLSIGKPYYRWISPSCICFDCESVGCVHTYWNWSNVSMNFTTYAGAYANTLNNCNCGSTGCWCNGCR